MKYLINQQIKRALVVALLAGYTYLQLYHIVPFNLIYLLIAYVVGLFAFCIITHKIRIVAAHIESHKQERHNHHG
jgi:hypothetical protein